MAALRSGLLVRRAAGMAMTSAARGARSLATMPAAAAVSCVFLAHELEALSVFEEVMGSIGLECRRSEALTDSGLPFAAVEAITDTGTLEIVHLSRLDTYLLNKRHDRLARLLAVTMGRNPDGWKQCLPDSSSQLPGAAGRGSRWLTSLTSSLQWNRFASGIGCEPRVISSAACTPTLPPVHGCSAGGVPHRPTLKEIVIGASTADALTVCEATLRSAGWHRNPRSLAVWEAEGTSPSPVVRVLPSRHSAAVLRVENLDAAAARLSDAAGISCSLHGAKAGSPLSGRGSGGDQHHGQLALSIAALPGFDLRLTTSDSVQPYWAESDAASNQDVDVALNPPADSALARASLSCGSVVGRQVLSGVKGRFAFLRDI